MRFSRKFNLSIIRTNHELSSHILCVCIKFILTQLFCHVSAICWWIGWECRGIADEGVVPLVVDKRQREISHKGKEAQAFKSKREKSSAKPVRRRAAFTLSPAAEIYQYRTLNEFVQNWMANQSSGNFSQAKMNLNSKNRFHMYEYPNYKPLLPKAAAQTHHHEHLNSLASMVPKKNTDKPILELQPEQSIAHHLESNGVKMICRCTI